MSDLAVIAPDTTFEVDTGIANAFLALGIPMSIDGIDADVFKRVKTTNLLSTRGSKLPGLPEYEDMTVKMLYDRVGYGAARALKGVLGHNYKITLSNNDVFTIAGYIQAVGKVTVPEADSESPDTYEIVLAVNLVVYSPVEP